MGNLSVAAVVTKPIGSETTKTTEIGERGEKTIVKTASEILKRWAWWSW